MSTRSQIFFRSHMHCIHASSASRPRMHAVAHAGHATCPKRAQPPKCFFKALFNLHMHVACRFVEVDMARMRAMRGTVSAHIMSDVLHAQNALTLASHKSICAKLRGRIARLRSDAATAQRTAHEVAPKKNPRRATRVSVDAQRSRGRSVIVFLEQLGVVIRREQIFKLA